MSEVAGDIARQMAGNTGKTGNPILATLGRPTFLPGDGRTYARTTGFGSNKTPHPQGGTNETIAWVIFKPFKGSDLTLEGRVYLQRFVVDGKKKRVYDVALSFLKAERRDVASRQLLNAAKDEVRDLCRAWLASGNAKKETAIKADTAGQWTEEDDE